MYITLRIVKQNIVLKYVIFEVLCLGVYECGVM